MGLLGLSLTYIKGVRLLRMIFLCKRDIYFWTDIYDMIVSDVNMDDSTSLPSLSVFEYLAAVHLVCKKFYR